MYNMVGRSDDSHKSAFKSARSSPQLTPTRIFNNQVESIIRDQKKEHSQKTTSPSHQSPSDSNTKRGCADGADNVNEKIKEEPFIDDAGNFNEIVEKSCIDHADCNDNSIMNGEYCRSVHSSPADVEQKTETLQEDKFDTDLKIYVNKKDGSQVSPSSRISFKIKTSPKPHSSSEHHHWWTSCKSDQMQNSPVSHKKTSGLRKDDIVEDGHKNSHRKLPVVDGSKKYDLSSSDALTSSSPWQPQVKNSSLKRCGSTGKIGDSDSVQDKMLLVSRSLKRSKQNVSLTGNFSVENRKHDNLSAGKVEENSYTSTQKWTLSYLEESKTKQSVSSEEECNASFHSSFELSVSDGITDSCATQAQSVAKPCGDDRDANVPYTMHSGIQSSNSSSFSSMSDIIEFSQPVGIINPPWPFAMSPAYFATTPPPPIRGRTPSDHLDRLTSPTYASTLNQDKRYQCLQTLHMPPKPNYHGFQLIGDSMLLRFSHQILGESPILAESLRFLGYCVSGQRIGELLKRLKSGFYHLGKRVVLMIGTNDLLKNTRIEQMCVELRHIVEHLKEFSEQVVILTLPPVPLLENSTDHWRRLQEYNTFIKNLSLTDTFVEIIDAYPLFTDRRIPKCRLECFEVFYTDMRKDMIHLNNKGLQIVDEHVRKNLP